LIIPRSRKARELAAPTFAASEAMPLITAVVVASLAAVALPRVAADHPIAGVITLLEKLEVQTKEEGEVEAATYQKFQYWCKRSTRRLARGIKKENKAIGELADKIKGLTADVETTGEDIKAYEAQLEVLDKQANRAKGMRQDEHVLYEDDVENLDDTISATDEALVVLEEGEQAASATTLLQVADKATPEDLLKLDPSKGNPFKPKAKAFSAHAGGVIETFKKLEDDWGIDKLSEEEQEQNAINAYRLAKQARDSAIGATTRSKAQKESIKSDKESAKAQAEGEKAEQERELSSDTASLESTDQECKTKNEEWAERSKVRSGELEAIAMAKKILSKVTGVRNPDTHEIPTKSLIVATARTERDTANFQAAVSFLQVRDPKAKAVNLLRKTATALHNKALERLAEEIGSYDGPFDKIKAMIQKMIFHLMGEQKDEDEHKLWCDMEFEKSTESKEDRSDKVSLYNSKIAEMDATIKLLAKKIVENNEKVKQITEYMNEETALRDENHVEIESTITDAQDAQAALTDAVQVLRNFYKESGQIMKEPWEFIQTSGRGVELPDSPATWDSSYTGVTDPKSGADGVLTLLDETMDKFSRMEADAKVQDETDQKEYLADMAAKKIEIDETQTDTQMKTTKRNSMQESMEGAAATLKHTSSELDAVEQYLKDLEPACGTGDSSYDDRKTARAEEIQALRRAQTILEEAFRAKLIQK
jgi:hypothetical protein